MNKKMFYLIIVVLFMGMLIIGSSVNSDDDVLVDGDYDTSFYVEEETFANHMPNEIVEVEVRVMEDSSTGEQKTYYNLVEVNVFSNDRVYMNDILGSYEEKVKIVFIKNNKKLNYEDIFIYYSAFIK